MTELGTTSLGVFSLGESGARFANEVRFTATFNVSEADIRATFDVEAAELDGWIIDTDLDE